MYDIENALRRRAMMERLKGLRRADRAITGSPDLQHEQQVEPAPPATTYATSAPYLSAIEYATQVPVVETHPADSPQLYDDLTPLHDNLTMSFLGGTTLRLPGATRSTGATGATGAALPAERPASAGSTTAGATSTAAEPDDTEPAALSRLRAALPSSTSAFPTPAAVATAEPAAVATAEPAAFTSVEENTASASSAAAIADMFRQGGGSLFFGPANQD